MIDPVVSPPATPPASAPGVCRVCGCTEEDCRQCIAATGEPCSWVDENRDLCTRCAAEAEMSEPPAIDIRALPLDSIVPSPYQHRGKILEEHLADLVASIRVQGVLSPVTVRPVADGQYELVFGERRWRACKLAGFATIPAIVREMTETEAAAACLDENLRRRDLEPMEESEGVCHLLRLMGDPSAVADRLGKSPGWVARRAKLADLVEEWRRAASDPQVSPAVSTWGAVHLEVIARLPSDLQVTIWKERHYWLPHRPTVAEVEKLTASFLRTLAGAPWSLDDESLVPDAGACTACPKRSGAEPLLFQELVTKRGQPSDRCLDRRCWDAKAGALIVLREKELRAEVGVDGYVRLKHSDRMQGKTPSGARVVAAHEMEPAKRSTSGAIRVLHIDGTQAGHVEWMVPKPGFTRAPIVDPATGVVAVKRQSLAERREALERRRLRLLAEVVRIGLWGEEEDPAAGIGPPPDHAVDGVSPTWLAAGPQRPSHDDLVALAIAVGTSRGSGDSMITGGWRASRGADTWTCFEASRAPSPEVDAMLWADIVPVLDSRLHTSRWPSGFALQLYREEVERVAGLIGLDLVALRAVIATKLPDPKSWAVEAAAEAATKKKRNSKAKPAAAAG